MLAKFDFVPQLFAVLFFLMLITLGLGSAVGFISAVTTTIYDSFPGVDQKFILKICCVVGSVAKKTTSLFVSIIRILCIYNSSCSRIRSYSTYRSCSRSND